MLITFSAPYTVQGAKAADVYLNVPNDSTLTLGHIRHNGGDYAFFLDGTTRTSEWATKDDAIEAAHGEAMRILATIDFTPEPDEERIAPEPKAPRKCDACGGSGRYIVGPIVNGVGIDKGQCFRCRGKGHQTYGDQKRNRYYDDRIRRIPE